MIILSDKKTYSFEGIHIPRIYINDVKKIRKSLEVLQRNGSLTNKEMAEETARVRSEDIREILYLLWRLGLGIDITKKGKEIAFLANDKLQAILELNDNNLKELILEKLELYSPFIAVLGKLIDYREKSVEFSEKDITKDFHSGRFDGGRIDNTHPLLRWSKDKDWGLVVNKEITDKGIKYVNEAKKLSIVYIHHTIDLNASEKLNIITHIISDASFEEKSGKISFENILGLTRNINSFKLDKKELIFYLGQLVKIGLPIVFNHEGIEIKNKIYHDITPQYYIKFKIHLIDGINELEIKKGSETNALDRKKILREYSGVINLIIHDEEIDAKKYPKQSKKISYAEFININEFLPELKIKNIILPPGWKPLKVSKINGIFLAFVKSGGNLLIFHAPMGRIGSNRNLFNWLPYDLERISFVHSRDGTNLKGHFTFPFGEKFIFTHKHNYKEVTKGSKKYSILFTDRKSVV